MSHNNNVDITKAWRNAVLVLVCTPAKFAIQCGFLYATLPYFFGTSFNAGFQTVLYFTAGLWAVVLCSCLIETLVDSWQKKLLRGFDPEGVDRRELKFRRKQHDQLTMLTNGSKAGGRDFLMCLKRLPRNLCRMLVILLIAVNAFPNLFENRSLTPIVEFALAFAIFECLLNAFFSLFYTKDCRRTPTEFALDGNEKKRVKRGPISEALNEAQEEQAVAFARYNLAIEMSPTAENYLRRAHENLKNRDAIPAIDDFEQVMKLDPTSAEAFEGRAETFQTIGLLHFARNDFLDAAKLASEFNPSIHERIMGKLKDLGARSNPLNPFRNPRETLAATSTMFNPDSKAMENIKLENVELDLQADIRSSDVYLRRALALFAKRDYPRALEACDKSIDLSPDNAASYRTRASVYVQLMDIEAAMHDYDKAIKLNEKDWDAYEERARIKLALGEFGAVVRECTYAMESSKSLQFKLMRGTALVALKHYDESLGDLTDFIDKWEGFIAIWDAFWLPIFRSIADGLRTQLRDAYEQRAIAYDQLGDLDKAAQDLVKATQLKEREERKSSRKRKHA
ncbi:MAG: tetratricopeptide repeat protein [Candidatus Melainabacteria bacterium]|nr:tetratricopeptide repeat protein [Candidatus Melainabacteria bacterium]